MTVEESWKDIPTTLKEMMGSVRDTLTVERVVGEPIDRDGVTLVPVASIRGGVGGGGGEGQGASDEEGSGGGAGFGVSARPVGAYVIRSQDVDWKPAVDPARMALVVMFVALLVTRTLRSLLARR